MSAKDRVMQDYPYAELRLEGTQDDYRWLVVDDCSGEANGACVVLGEGETAEAAWADADTPTEAA